MAIPKWRRVQETDDGCYLYQCLSCYNRWEARSNPDPRWRFCPYCGVQWEGRHSCREHGEPTHEEPRDYWSRMQVLDGRRPIWTIEQRTTILFGQPMTWAKGIPDSEKWERIGSVDLDRFRHHDGWRPARAVLDHLKLARRRFHESVEEDDEDIRTHRIFRARIVPRNEVS